VIDISKKLRGGRKGVYDLSEGDYKERMKSIRKSTKDLKEKP
jgi:hypothetical protein